MFENLKLKKKKSYINIYIYVCIKLFLFLISNWVVYILILGMSNIFGITLKSNQPNIYKNK